VIKQVIESPFASEEFLNLVDKFDNQHHIVVENFKIENSIIKNIGSRNLVDYRPNVNITQDVIRANSIKLIQFDSMHYFQIKELYQKVDPISLQCIKSDVSVNLQLSSSYEEYLASLTKKRRHELKRKKRIFSDSLKNFSLQESNNKENFDAFISQHQKSSGEKGSFMTIENIEYFELLYQLPGWKLYYLQSDFGDLSYAFVYESNDGVYLYNSSKNPEFDHLNSGIVLIDLIVQKLIDEKKVFFDFLKGTERYKFDLGGEAVQLYDVELKI
jgi:hypothetical protein